MRFERLLPVHYGITIFLSAFLLFQVQPIVGKMILPWFGGAAAVWTACMLFFQILLLLGYLYCHAIVRYLPPAAQSRVHLALLGLSLLALPLGLDPSWRPTGGEDPTLRILAVLALGAGLPYFVLTTTSPLVQVWFARERPAAVPYRLFALSNVGSLAALLSFPVLVEPLLPGRVQALLWSAGYACFAVACALLGWRAGRLGNAPPPVATAPAPNGRLRLLWVTLAAIPSLLLLAITSHLTENIAPVPLLWIVPLALYLVSFIICFEHPRHYRRRIYRPLLAVGLAGVALQGLLPGGQVPMLPGAAVHLFAFFAACMVCHGELARRQPAPVHLTGYYLMLALGGAVGGLFVGVLAPYAFNDSYELPIGLVALTVMVWGVLPSLEEGAGRMRPAVGWGLAASLIAAIGVLPVVHAWQGVSQVELTARNFYGRLKVQRVGVGEGAYRSLSHGRILHGKQFLTPERRTLPTAYYGPESGAGRAFAVKRTAGEPLRVGVIGLGVGTLAAYGRAGDKFRFYDINPLVVDVARRYFSYLPASPAVSAVVPGDARLALETESEQAFDLLLVDAFSGDAVPVHLLTQEAFAVYLRHLRPDGVLAVHVSNRYLRLEQVVKAVAESHGRAARLIHGEADVARQWSPSDWVLVSADPSLFAQPELRDVAAEIAPGERFPVWRDDYSSLLMALKPWARNL